MSEEMFPAPPVPPMLPPPLPILSVPPPLPPRPLGWGKGLLLCLIFQSIMAFSLVVRSLAMHGLDWTVDSPTGAMIDLLCTWPLMLLLACVIAPVDWRHAFAFTRFPLWLLPPLVISGLGLSFLLVEVSGWIPTPEFIEELFRELMDGNPVAKLVAIVIIAPVAEEMLFRGLIFREFARRYSVRHAILGSAALFALFHLNPWQAVIAFPIGVLAAWLVLRTGSIVPGIVLHAAFNFTSSFLLVPVGSFFGQEEEAVYALPHLPWQMLVLGGVATVIGLAGVWLCARNRQTVSTVDTPAT